MSTSVSTSFGTIIFLDNYLSNNGSGGPLVTYLSTGIPANGVSLGGGQGTPGTGLSAGWTAGFYWAAGDQLANIFSDPTGQSTPSGGGLALATGPGSTASFYTSSFNTPGEFLATAAYVVPGVATGGTITMEVIAYNTSAGSYANANYRGHSAPFLMTVSDPTSNNPNKIGDFMPAFGISVPEPSIFTLAGLGGVAWVVSSRRKRNNSASPKL